jgi:hypothetical protein
MDAEQLRDYTTWRWLWAHTARQIISALALPANYELVQIGYGWAARSCTSQMTLRLHPSGANHDSGDLSLSISGRPTSVIPREGRQYAEYVEYAAEVVARAFQEYFADESLGEPTTSRPTPTR